MRPVTEDSYDLQMFLKANILTSLKNSIALLCQWESDLNYMQ